MKVFVLSKCWRYEKMKVEVEEKIKQSTSDTSTVIFVINFLRKFLKFSSYRYITIKY